MTALGGTPEPSAFRHALGGGSALGGSALGGSAEDRPAIAERRLRAVHWSEAPPAPPRDDDDASGLREAEEDLTPSTSGEFDPYRFGSHMLPYEFLQDALKEPLRAPRDEDLLHETLPPYAADDAAFVSPTPLSPAVAPADSTPPAATSPLASVSPAASVPPVVVDPKKTLVTGLRLSPEAVQRLRGPELVTAPGYEDPLAARRSKQTALFWAVGVLGVTVALAGGLWAGQREAALAGKAPHAQRDAAPSTKQPGSRRAAEQSAASPVQAPSAVEPAPTFDALEAARPPLLPRESAPRLDALEPVVAPLPAVNPPQAPPTERARQTATTSSGAAASSAPRTAQAPKTSSSSALSEQPSAREEVTRSPAPPSAERSAPLAQTGSSSAAAPARDFQLRD